jgi:hypothetical protein
MRRNAWSTILAAIAVQAVVVARAEAGAAEAVLLGVVRDASDGKGIAGAVVTVTGVRLQGERVMTTDARGVYRLADLPAGTYALTVVHPDFGAGERRTGVELRSGVTARVDVRLVRSRRDVVVVDVPAPTVDVGSSTTGLSLDGQTARRVPIVAPIARGGAARSFEAVAEAAPGARSDLYGTGLAGTTSPENRYQIDGLTVNDPSVGLGGTPLSVEFLEAVHVETGGFMPEHGRSTGGNIHAVTKSGSNDFHGGVWAYYTPGELEGRREIPRIERQTIVTERTLGWVGDVGFDVGGRLVRDKLWFYGGVSLSRTVHALSTSWNRIAVGPDGEARIDQDTGLTGTERIAGTTSSSRAHGSGVQALVKLTYSPAKQHTLELLAIYAPQRSGGGGGFGLNPRTGAPEVGHIIGDYTALARKYREDAADLLLRWNARAGDGRWNFETLLGWHHQDSSALPVDGSRLGSGIGLAATPMVMYRRSDVLAVDGDGDGILDAPLAPGDASHREVHAVTDFMPLPAGAPAGACDPTPFTFHNPTTMLAEHRTVVCPAGAPWFRHGPGLIYERRLDRAQVRHAVARLARGAGHHLIKFGVDFEYLHYVNDRGYTGDRVFRENFAGTAFAEHRQYGFLGGPDEPHVLHRLHSDVGSTTIGGFLQDSWSIMDRVTLNAGLRYDAQQLFVGDTLVMVMPNQLSPRAGLIWDPTYAGKAKLFVNYGRLYQTVPLNVVDVASSGEPAVSSIYQTTRCDPNDRSAGSCFDDDTRIDLGGATDPSRSWLFTSAGQVPIDPRLKPQASDEIVAGGEYELFAGMRIGAQYSHRQLVRIIEDMSRDESKTYFIGNPGFGVADDFPRARRLYDAATLTFERRFDGRWHVLGSYTASWLRGNVSGLFRPENGQLAPNMNSDFDLIAMRVNRDGDLPGDNRHSLKLFASGEIALPHRQSVRLGAAVRARSGGPTNYLANQLFYGHSEIFILPRGAGERLPWVFGVDPSVAYTKRMPRDVSLTVSIDVFNVANFQQVLAIDERYTTDEVKPIAGGAREDLKMLLNTGEKPVAVNPNFGNPTAYQPPRQFRFGVRLTF